jgi:hypothetical protein
MKMLHVEFVCASGEFAFLLGEPDFFFGDVGERRDGGRALSFDVLACARVLCDPARPR